MSKTFRFENIGEEYVAATLSNGLEVRVVEKPGFRTSYAAFAVKYGGADRDFVLDGERISTPAGIAHYLEHKMFDMPDGDNSLNMLTANGADPNAYTSVAMTCYYFQCTEKFYENLSILLRFVTTPYFTDETVEKERGIIGQEIMMGLDNPYRNLYYNLLGMLYHNHPIAEDIAGSVESISHITAQTLYDCHRTFYCPGNMVLCVEGDVSAERVIAVAEDVLKDWKTSPVPRADYGEPDGLLAYEGYRSVALPVSEKNFYLGAKMSTQTDSISRKLLAAKLGLQTLYGPSSEFFNRLYEQGLINYTFSWDVDYTADTATVIIGGETSEPDRVVEEIQKTAEKAAAEGLDKAAFERNKRATIGGSLRSFEDFDNVCTSMAEGVFLGFDIFEAPAVIAEITPEESAAAVTECLVPERIAVSVIVPA